MTQPPRAPTAEAVAQFRALLEKATPGPWSYQEESDRYTHIVRSGERKFVCQFPQDLSGRAEADARLIVLIRTNAEAMLASLQRHAESERHTDRSVPCPTCGFCIRKVERIPFVFDDGCDEPEQSTLSQGDGHDEPCYYCGQPCTRLSGDPSQWPVPLCHSDAPGVTKWHHVECVTDRLIENQSGKGAEVVAFANSLEKLIESEREYGQTDGLRSFGFTFAEWEMILSALRSVPVPAPGVTVMDEQVISGAAAIVDVWMGKDRSWRERLARGDSDFLESADWQNAMRLSHAVLEAALSAALRPKESES